VRANQVVIIGAGMAGLVAALELATRGIAVTVFERAAAAGGKLREVEIAGRRLDAGPTVFTMRAVFDEIFAMAGACLADYLTLQPVEILARHAWSESERLDLYADPQRSAAAIGDFAGPAEARRFLEFSERARRTYETLEQSFIRSPAPTPLTLVRAAGLHGLRDLSRISPFATLWRALGEHFHDPRLRQLFGRYATYCGASPFLAPATLMLIAHVERDGVWLIEGGMHKLAQALADLAARQGATFRYGAAAAEIIVAGGKVAGVKLVGGERIDATAVVVNADVAAVAGGLLGAAAAPAVAATPRAARSLSALTWNLLAPTAGFPLLRHNVFFSGDYAAEFDDIFKRSRLPQSPTVYVCAQDRDASGNHTNAQTGDAERLLCLINAPPTGDSHPFDSSETAQCEERTFSLLARCGLQVDRNSGHSTMTSPAEFNRLFPATGGALYGQASHGWMSSFSRPGARSRLPGLYLAGGSTHPGPGLPMAALSGRFAAAAVLADLVSDSRSRAAVTPGGTSTR
jgi:1-hydroxycarotenoid 3,4-desaturase